MGRILRPKATVLPKSALVPEENLAQPPAHFTHEVVAEQPYFYAEAGRSRTPDGTFAAGTKVQLLSHDQGELCRVVDGQGLRVSTAFEGLRALKHR